MYHVNNVKVRLIKIKAWLCSAFGNNENYNKHAPCFPSLSLSLYLTVSRATRIHFENP